MGWKTSGRPMVRKQRDEWVVRVNGINTETGKHRPRQLRTYVSRRSALAAARSLGLDERVARRDTGQLVGALLRRLAHGRDTQGARTVRVGDPAHRSRAGRNPTRRLDREGVARWLDDMASAGPLSWRSIKICRTVLPAALPNAVEEGLLERSPAARVPMPREVAKPPTEHEVDAWTGEQVARFLAVSTDHRWSVAFRLNVLYGLRRSGVLALKWDDLDATKGTLRVEEGLVAASKRAAWSKAKNTRSRRLIPLDDETLRALARHRVAQAEDRLRAGAAWEDHDLMTTTHVGRPVMPRRLDRALEVVIAQGALPKLTSHGLRHTAATHMVGAARDVGELRAVADVLGHSPGMLMRVYAHSLPESTRAVAERISARATAPAKIDSLGGRDGAERA
jgi:integrase